MKLNTKFINPKYSYTHETSSTKCTASENINPLSNAHSKFIILKIEKDPKANKEDLLQ
jgi:hypothetical protein